MDKYISDTDRDREDYWAAKDKMFDKRAENDFQRDQQRGSFGGLPKKIMETIEGK